MSAERPDTPTMLCRPPANRARRLSIAKARGPAACRARPRDVLLPDPAAPIVGRVNQSRDGSRRPRGPGPPGPDQPPGDEGTQAATGDRAAQPGRVYDDDR